MKIGFFGAGKVAVSLGKYFKNNGLDIAGFYSKTFASTEFARDFTETNGYSDLESFVLDCDIIFITTNDDELVNGFNEISNFDLENKIIVNTSGSYSSSIFSNARELGAFPYSLHPIYPFSDKETSYKNLGQAVFTLEGAEEKLSLVKGLVEGCGNKVILMKGDKKTYHLACAMASNLTLALLSLSSKYLQKVGFNEEDSIAALRPLVESNINSIFDKGFVNSLTGPVVRGDVDTIEGHLSKLNECDKEVYKRLSLELLDLSIERNGLSNKYKKINSILGGNENEKY